MEQWVPILDYPGYSVSNLGRIRSDRYDRMLKIIEKRGERSIVELRLNGFGARRSVSKLVSEAFLSPPEKTTFNTPIHLDGDLTNCQAINLAWRPRWFAIKHIRQFSRSLPEFDMGVREIETGAVFDNAWDTVFRQGLLYMDLLLGIGNKTYVFPTMNHYEWAR